MKNHALFNTLFSLRGNQRACIYTEPLWGIAFNLYLPYVSVYMIAIGLSEQQIGSIISISLGLQIGMAMLSGVVTDKLGRRMTTLLFDLLAWSIPALISAAALNFWYFLAAALFNSFWRITYNSWTCLLVEDADPDQLVDIYTWIYIANQMVGFIAPLAGMLVGAFSLVPTMRALYLFAAVMFTLKAVVTYLFTEETRQGTIRMEETRHQSTFSVLGEYRGVISTLLRTPQTLYTGAIVLVMSITGTISGSFWSIIVTQKLLLPEQHLAIFPFVRSSVMLLFFFLIMPRLNRMDFKLPMLIGFAGYILSNVLLVTAPTQSYGFLLASVLIDACCFAAIGPLVDKLMVLTINAKERARIQSILYVGIILFTSPFGWIAGTLSEMNKNLPFMLNMALFALGALFAYKLWSTIQKQPQPEAVLEPAA